MAERNGLLNRRRGQTLPRVRIPLSPPFFVPPPDSLNQSQFAQPPLKPVAAKAFTMYVAVCLKHTQTAKSERFLPIFASSTVCDISQASFTQEISGSWKIFNFKYSRSRKPYACLISHRILLLNPSVDALVKW